MLDMSETELFIKDPEILEILLKDQTTTKNILWLTDNYTEKYNIQPTDEIKPESITYENENVIQPRCVKSKEVQKERTKTKAEVFTPTWICRKQNDMIDKSFGDINWKDYVKKTVLEITCGEGPYLVNRYDATTGQMIEDLNFRTGIFDRKMYKIQEHCKANKKAWILWSLEALKSTYGYEWQGDSLFIARENLLQSYVDYYSAVWEKRPAKKLLKIVATIISWNLWQMDGLKMTIPMTDIKCKVMNWKNKTAEEFS